MTATIYSLISPNIIQQLPNEGAPPQSTLPIQINTCIVPIVREKEESIRKRFNGSVIQIWDARNPSTPTLLSRPYEGKPLTNYRNLYSVDNYFRSIFNQPAVNDDKGLIRSFLSHPQAYNNAFWNPKTKSVYYGEVDPRIFTPFVDNQEITTHEFGHAITDLSSRLNYCNQSGALNESISDVFAIIHKHLINNTQSAAAPDASWLIGEGVVVTENGPYQSLRSMRHPGTAYTNHPYLKSDPQTSHMDNYLTVSADNDYGAVHTNSGIPNRAFYLAAYNYAEPTWKTMGKVWYNALLACEPTENFSGFAERTIEFAKEKKNAADIVAKAWQNVGVDLRNLGHKRRKT